MRIHYILSVLGLLLSVLVFERPGLEMAGSDGQQVPIDLAVQDHFYKNGKWLIEDGQYPALHAVIYDGVKIVLVTVGILPLLYSAYCFYGKQTVRARKALFLTVCLSLVPATISLLKATTNVYVPSKVERYGGNVPYVKAFDAYPNDYVPSRPGSRGRGFPAGHASGGFALIALVFLAKTLRGKIVAWTVALTMGSLMGIYQMARGEHYLSHNFFTLFIAWLMITVIAQLLLKRIPESKAAENDAVGKK